MNTRNPDPRHRVDCRLPNGARRSSLRRSLGSQARPCHVDPFLMLDEFYSDNPDDYMARLPGPHPPPRAFENRPPTCSMATCAHEDHLGNRGDPRPRRTFSG